MIDNQHSLAAKMVIPPRVHRQGQDNLNINSHQLLFIIGEVSQAIVKHKRCDYQTNTLLLIERDDATEIHKSNDEHLHTLNYYISPNYN